jgi:hypothetical protein
MKKYIALPLFFGALAFSSMGFAKSGLSASIEKVQNDVDYDMVARAVLCGENPTEVYCDSGNFIQVKPVLIPLTAQDVLMQALDAKNAFTPAELDRIEKALNNLNKRQNKALPTPW